MAWKMLVLSRSWVELPGQSSFNAPLALNYTPSSPSTAKSLQSGGVSVSNKQSEYLQIKKYELHCEIPRNPAKAYKTVPPKLPKLLAFLQTDLQPAIQQKDGEILFPGKFCHGRLPWNQIFGDDLGFPSSMVVEAYYEIQLHVGVHDGRIDFVIAPNPDGFTMSVEDLTWA